MLLVDVSAFGKAADWDRLPADIARMNFGRTASMKEFPGALLPAISPVGQVLWYAAAGEPRQWRQLAPLLRAFAGPTVTEFDGQRQLLRPGVSAEAVLLQGGIASAAVLVPSKDTVMLCARALFRLVTSIENRPTDIRPPPLSTASLLARFENALAIGNRTDAEKWLSVLRAEWRLDEHNLLFAEVRLLWSFRDWQALVTALWLPSLVFIRKPASIAHMLLEGLWRAYLEPTEGDTARLEDIYRRTVRKFALPLLDDLPSEGDFVSRFRAIEGSDQVTKPEHPPLAQQATPKDWLAWFSALSDPSYDDYIFDARELSARQDAGQLLDRTAIKHFADRLSSTSGDATERLNSALPTLMQWLKSDASFPRNAMRPIYDAIFTLFALLDSHDRFERDAITDLFDALLTVGQTRESYSTLVQDMSDLVAPGAGLSSVYWLLDIADIVVQHPAANPDARDLFLGKIVSSLQPLTRLLDVEQRAAYALVATAAGWDPLPERAAPERDNLWRNLEGKTVALYTLTDASARQAKQVLEGLVPQIKVELSNDHVCTTRLQTLARRADLFVIATASAKHAATDCIMRHREGAPLAYAAGRGFSSFVRAVAEFIETKKILTV